MIESILVSGIHAFLRYINHSLEQYAYMCDLKRTLDATVSLPTASAKAKLTQFITGSLCARDAFGNWQNCVPALAHRLISAGSFSFNGTEAII